MMTLEERANVNDVSFCTPPIAVLVATRDE